MKRFLTAFLAVITAIVCFGITAYAAGTPAVPDVYYKLVNHDKVTLKWNKVSGAEKYYIYVNDSATGKNKKIAATSKTSYSLKGLDAYTEYTYAVKAVGNGGNSKLGSVTFTTPELWYYEVGTDSFTDDVLHYSHRNVYRRHYDGSGREKFDAYAVIKVADENEEFAGASYAYSVIDVEQQFGYVYFTAQFFEIDDAEEFDFYRMKNDGTEPVAFGGMVTNSVIADDFFFAAPDKMYLFRDSRFSNGEYIGLNQATVSLIEKKEEYKNFRIGYVFSAAKTCLSKPVLDGDSIYWFASPYRSYIDSDMMKYTEDEITPNTSTEAFLYKAKIGGEPESIAKFRFKTSYGEDSIMPVGIYNGNIYYSQQEGAVSDGRKYFGFYKISLTDKNAKPVKLFRTRSNEIEAFIYDGMLVVTENESYNKKKDTNSCNIYTYDLNAKKPAIKTIKHINTYSRHNRGKTLFEDIRIINGRIFFKAYKTKTDGYLQKSPIYYSIKLDGSGTQKSSKPFV